MTDAQLKFIEKIAKAVKKYAPKYGIKIYSPIIAQAILESAWGKSKLAEKNNFFGLKAGSSFKGDTIQLETKEEINGKLVVVSDTFRAFKSVDAGVKGYFDFINTKRYENLKGVTDPETYLTNIKKDGYATASNYVPSLMRVIAGYNLTSYDDKKTEAAPVKKETVTDYDNSIKNCFDMIASDIIKHPALYGNAEIRKERIYKEIQLRVNRIIAKR